MSSQAIARNIIFTVWGSLLAMTAVEVFLAYENLALKLMFSLLIGISVLKASLIVAYFMHLRYERRGMIWTLVPAFVFVLIMMFGIFPDSLRLFHMRVPGH
jgi:cytochrome c oxidase subunit 4